MALAVEGALGRHPMAEAFAREAFRLHRRYAIEIVSAFRLCPFVRSGGDAVEAAFGRFCVVLDRELDAARACRVAMQAPEGVVHLVYPLVQVSPASFERFAASIG